MNNVVNNNCHVRDAQAFCRPFLPAVLLGKLTTICFAAKLSDLFFERKITHSRFPLLMLSVDGQWSGWKPWSGCTRSCGSGIQTRARTCTNPSPAHGGQDCVGLGDETRTCNNNPCPGKLQDLSIGIVLAIIWYCLRYIRRLLNSRVYNTRNCSGLCLKIC